jgi:DNA uptake protein ComE-like DNA-binding protein
VKKFFKSLFGASSKEVSGLLFLAILLIITLFIPGVIRSFSNTDHTYLEEDTRKLDSLITYLETKYAKEIQYDSIQVVAPFHFNPNDVSIQELMSLGFKEKIAGRIHNYREKGGRFRIKSDLYKIYDIDSILIGRLYTFIDLPEKTKVETETLIEENMEKVAKVIPVKSKKKELPRFDINLADTAMLQTISGIGTVLSGRIVDFRTKLGGFVSMNQLYEVYNLDSAIVLKLFDKGFIDPDFKPAYLLINKFSEKELASHPYITWQQARLIAAFRNQHGHFSSAEDLLKVYAINEDDILKINSYLSYESDN